MTRRPAGAENLAAGPEDCPANSRRVSTVWWWCFWNSLPGAERQGAVLAFGNGLNRRRQQSALGGKDAGSKG
ncbi:MAG: hypothetical protein ACO3NZ_15935, partial [Pirellulales bacterium]